MVKKGFWLNLLVVLPLLFLFGCTDFGKVDQGRVVKYDKEKQLVTIIRDVKHDPANPNYSYLPPLTYSLPAKPAEMGPEPKAGGRMKIDKEKKQIIIFDPGAQNFKTIDIQIVDAKENVERQDPLVYDAAEKKAKKLPAVDKEKKTVTLYSGRQKLFIVFSVPEEYFAMPDSTWDAGDEARIYYKEEGKALRFMNISKTDIFRR
ncbi:MAG TPA: DUF4881 domain-containing protein [Syntrophobacteria bacterium]|nr:DUF4881 domain-containing protein [Syntrophobacteria bacterium]